MPRAARTREVMLETLELGRAFGPVIALRDLNLKVYGGECVALMGPNGSGKTTAAELISGLLEPSTGWVKVQGYAVHDEPTAIEARARLAYVPDTPRLYDDLTVLDHLHLVAVAHGTATDDLEDRCWDLLERLGLDERADFFPPQLSRGMRQKTAIACALIRPFSLLIMDEPIVGLDADSVEALRQVVLECRADKRAVLLMTHSDEFAASVATRTLRIVEGLVGR
ncbi:MAG: ABC transporter ATP-binding protein [Actinobacteria bacterium]|nr:ABC transporter ATP-binding protein [Actinomycetota bacterium]